MPYSTAYENLGLRFFVRSLILSFLLFFDESEDSIIRKA